MVSELAVEAQVSEVAASEFVHHNSVDDKIWDATNVGVLADKISATSLAVALLHSQNVVATSGQARAVADLLQRS